MNPLQGRLAALRRRMRLVTLIRGISVLSLVVVGSLLLAGLLDWSWHLLDALRALVLGAVLGGAAVCGWRWLVEPLRRRTDDLTLALKIEAHYPVLNDALASTVQFLKVPEDSPTAGAPVLRREAVQRALRLAESCDFNQVIDTRGLRLTAGLAGVVTAAAVLLALSFPAIVWPGLLRLVHPFGGHDWGRATELTLTYRSKIANTEAFEIQARVTGKIPPNATVEFEGLHNHENYREAREYDIQKDEDGAAGNFVVKLDVSGKIGSFKFRVRANDARDPKHEGRWHTVQVGPPPHLVALNNQPSPRIVLDVPAYTDLPTPQELRPGTWEVNAWEGTWLHLQAAADRPLAQTWIEYNVTKPKVVLAARLAALGHAHPLAALAVHAGTAIALKPVPGVIDSSGRKLSFTFRPWLKGKYFLQIRDTENLPNKSQLTINLEPDPLPVVHLNRFTVDLVAGKDTAPSQNRSPTMLFLSPKAVIRVETVPEDERFGLRAVDLVFGPKDPRDGGMLDPTHIPLYDHQTAGQILAQVRSRLAGQPLRLPTPPLRLRPKYLQLERLWPLEGLVKEGDVLVAQVWAYDFNNVTAHRTPGKSDPIEIHIVSDNEFNNVVDDKQGQLYKRLRDLAQALDESQKNLAKLKSLWQTDGPSGEEQNKLLDKILKAQGKVRDEINGVAKEPGIRQEVDKLLDLVEDNQVGSSGARDRLQMLKKELDRLNNDHLPEIDKQLNKAARTAEKDADQKEAPKDTKATRPLTKASEHQKEVLQTVDNMLRAMSRWAGLQEIREETKAILQEQAELKNATEALKQPQNPMDARWQAELNRLAEQQGRLGDKAQNLLDKMDDVAGKKKVEDPALADMLEQAAQIGKEMKLPQEIQDTGKQMRRALPEHMNDTLAKLRQLQIHRAAKQQAESIKTLNEMMAALQEKRDDEIARLTKKQKKAKGEMDEVVEKLQKLQKKTADAAKIADPDERKEALQQLADEQRQLEEETQKKARELAQLRAEDAGDEMMKAAKELKEAAKKLGAGEDPGENQKNALKKLEEAKNQLKQAQDDAQEELAREKLLRIADQLKILKERQDAALFESERLHKDSQQAGWTRQLLISLLNHEDVQRSLAEETTGLAKQLAGARVFEAILSKAGKDMNEAAASLKKRRDQAALRVDRFPLDPDEVQEETQAQGLTVRVQKRAAGRLERLVAALKAELDRQKKAQEGGGGDGGGDQQPGGGQPQGGLKAQDGIPAVAQLKALRAEQQAVNERTDEFHKLHPANQALDPAAQAELAAIHAEQDTLFRLFRDMATAANQGEQK